MPRPAGVRNRDFADKRAALVSTLTDFALNSDLRRPSLRQFAIAAEASEPTLRHYFSDRQGCVIAILECIGQRGQALWKTISAPAPDVATAFDQYFRVSEAGMRHGGFIRAHGFGIIEGVADPVVGKAYLRFVLEPALTAVEEKIASSNFGITDQKRLRAIALATLSPMLVMSLHQDLLAGDVEWEIDSAVALQSIQSILSVGVVGLS
ncbi:MAG: hypothetical protein AAFQ22_09520 [Pseudomonadota bacterium]